MQPKQGNLYETPENDEDLSRLADNLFDYHPWSPDMVEAGDQVREVLKVAFKVIMTNVPESRDRSVAIRKLRELRMDCNSAITFAGKY